MNQPAHASNPESGTASLSVSVIHGLSTATTAWARSPLKLLTPRARGESVWAYTSSFGGGMVAGDCTRLDVTVDAGARCFLSTQASTKIYRNPASLPCSHETHATIHDDALLILAPDPVQCFAESSYEQRQHFTLGATANLLLVEWFSAGRTARGERWSFRRYASRNEVRRVTDTSNCSADLRSAVSQASSLRAAEISGGIETLSTVEQPTLSRSETGDTADRRSALRTRPLLIDALRLDRAHGPIDSKYRGGQFNCFATVVLLGPRLGEHARAILDWCSAQPITPGASLVFAASPLHEGAILRFAGASVEEVGRAIHERLCFVGELLDDDPWKRKW